MAGKTNRADRWLIGVSGVILLMALLFFAYGDRILVEFQERGETIGYVVNQQGDVRLKLGGDFRWNTASAGTELAYGDTIYAGDDSATELQIGDERLQIAADTLIVVRRPKDSELFGNLNLPWLNRSKNITVRKKANVVVLKGEAQLRSKRTLPPLQLANTQPPKAITPVRSVAPAPPRFEAKGVHALHPRAGSIVYSTASVAIPFDWTYGKSPVQGNDRFTLEFSETENFATLFDVKTVDGRARADYPVRDSVNLFYRVRGPNNELSQIEKIQFVRMRPPTVQSPRGDSIYSSRAGQPAYVILSFTPTLMKSDHWFQIAADAEFKTVVVNESVEVNRYRQKLPPGFYFFRVRNDYGSKRLSDWSKAIPFQVRDQSAEAPKLASENRVVIPNEAYPSRLYSAAIKDVQDYLFEKGFMSDYFRALDASGDSITLDFLNGYRPKTGPIRWPAEKILPQVFNYRYQILRKGLLPSRWSAPEKVEIWLAAPRDTTKDPRDGRVNSEGRIPMRVHFTPLLFVRRYEAQFDDNADFSSPRTTFADEPSIHFFAHPDRAYYWRVRAVTMGGRPVSDFSETALIQTGTTSPTVRLAKKDALPEASDRSPAQAEPIVVVPPELASQSLMKMGSAVGSYVNRFWAWLGSGWNSSTLSQSIAGRGETAGQAQSTLDTYGEMNWGNPTYGASASFRFFPGWDSLAAEAYYSPFSQFTIGGQPTTFGFRGGIAYQEMPFAFLNNTATSVDAALGIAAEMAVNRWHYYWLMHYLYPLSLTAPGSSLQRDLAFDGSLGTSYSLSEHLKAGLFWSSQWQQFRFTATDGAVTNGGSQNLFFSSLDLRFGYDF